MGGDWLHRRVAGDRNRAGGPMLRSIAELQVVLDLAEDREAVLVAPTVGSGRLPGVVLRAAAAQGKAREPRGSADRPPPADRLGATTRVQLRFEAPIEALREEPAVGEVRGRGGPQIRPGLHQDY